MMAFELREWSRFELSKLTSYNCLNENNEAFHQGLGRTLDMSKDGICLETNSPIDTQYRINMTMFIGDEMVDIDGKVVYCGVGKDNMFKSGIEFIEVDENVLQILDKHIIIKRLTGLQ